MAKTSDKAARRARAAELRRQAERAERRRTLGLVAVFAVIAVLIVGLTTWAMVTNRQQVQATAGADLADLGADAAAAGCLDVETTPADGSGEHLDGQQIDYDTAPPAYGPHWSGPAPFTAKFYPDDDSRPPLEAMVHNLEHGYTILWYDQTVAADDEQLQVVRDIAAKFDVGSPSDVASYNKGKFLAVPWTPDDGEAFPDGAHVALSHWSGASDSPQGSQGSGHRQYCDAPSGQAVADFVEAYPAEDAPEPGAA